MSLGAKISLCTVLALVITATATASVALVTFRQELCRQAVATQETRMKLFWELLRSKGKEFRLVENTLLVGDYPINGNFELPDKMKEISGGVATLFMRDTRVATNVLKPDGSRAVGTKLQGPAYDAVIKEGKMYRGEAPILNIPYFTAYDPIKNANGEIIGVLFVGIKKSDYLAAFNRLMVTIALVAFGVIVSTAVIIRFLMMRRLNKLNEIGMVISKAATGDIATRVEDSSRDEIGVLAGSINKMLGDMNTTLAKVVNASGEVASAAGDLNTTAVRMAGGIGVVATQAGTIAVATQQMAGTSNDIARNCAEAADGSRQANDSAVSGAAVVSETVAMMSRIAKQVETSSQSIEGLGQRSDQIGAIVGTIEDIADQTNLLALNAAIEAARAGEQGRGFAVVADEVRALAERTTKATKEISAMIKAIQNDTRYAVAAMNQGVKEVQDGTAEASKSCAALSEILRQIDSVTSQVNQIATAAEQQNATAGEISNNIQQITEVAQGTACGAQESAGAASRLARLAEEMQGLIGQFKLSA